MSYIIGDNQLIDICMYCNNIVQSDKDVCDKCVSEGFN